MTSNFPFVTSALGLQPPVLHLDEDFGFSSSNVTNRKNGWFVGSLQNNDVIIANNLNYESLLYKEDGDHLKQLKPYFISTFVANLKNKRPG